MTTPVVVKARIFAPDSGWEDISSSVRASRGVTITEGGSDELIAEAVPGSCELWLNNRDGRFSPRNPMSEFYDRIGQATQLQVSVQAAADDFSDTVASGWGSTDSGQAWATYGSGGSPAASDFNKAGGFGTMLVPAASSHRVAYLDGFAAVDVDVRLTADTAITDVTGGDMQIGNVLLRGVGTDATSTYYRVRVNVTAAEVVQIGLTFEDGSILVAPIDVDACTAAWPTALCIRAACEGDTIGAKVWPAGTPEPFDWAFLHNDPTYSAPGWVGVRTASGGTLSSVPFTGRVQAFSVDYDQHYGEVVEWPPRWDKTGTDVYVELRSEGILGRITAGSDPLLDAPSRYIPLSRQAYSDTPKPPVAYWPLTDGQLATRGEPVVGAHPMELTSPYALTRHWGQGDMGPFLLPTVASLGLDDLFGVVRMVGQVPGSVQWAVDHVRCGDLTSESLLVVGADSSTAGVGPGFVPAQSWEVRFIRTPDTPDGTIEVTSPDTVTSSPMVAPRLFDGLPHHVRLYCEQFGADTAYYIDLDGENLAAVFSGSTVLLPVAFVNFQNLETGGAGSGEPLAIGHVTVYGNVRPTAEFHRPALGWLGEYARDRLERVCNEEGITFTYMHSQLSVTPMGQQSPEPLVQVLTRCVDADGGRLGESRTFGGLWFRGRTTMYNQGAALTLAYPDGELAEVPKPRDDRRSIANRITVERINGGRLVTELETGRMSVLPPQLGGKGPLPGGGLVSLADDAQLAQHAAWLLHLGTWDEARWPELAVNLRSGNLSAGQVSAALTLRMGDLVAVTEPLTTIGAPEDVRQLVRAFEKRLDGFTLRVKVNAQPAGPWDVAVLDDGARARLDSLYTTAQSAVGSGDTSFVARRDLRRVKWITDPAHHPVPLMIGGEELSATDIEDVAVSFLGAGTAATANNGSTAPGYPGAGETHGDLLLIAASIRNSGTGTPDTPAGWTLLGDASNLRLFGRQHDNTTPTVTVTYSGGAANADTIAQMAAFRGIDLRDLVAATDPGSTLNGSAQDIAVAQLDFDPIRHALVLHLGWKADDWTSVAPVTNGTEIGEPDSTAGSDAGLTWAYRIITDTNPFSAIGARTFTVTGGGAAISRGLCVVLCGQLQTFTVARSVNGVVKGHVAGAPVRVAPHAVARLAK